MAGAIVHGVNAVREALREPGRINRLYFAAESRAHGVKQLIALAREGRLPFDFVPQAKLNEITGSREHQGVAAEISPVAYTSLEDCLACCGPQAMLLVLDRIQHPKNLGLLIRSAMGAGAAGILLSERGGALLDESVVRASAGAVLHVPIVPCAKLPAALGKLKEAGFWVYGLDAGARDSVFDVAWADRTALVVGNESDGIRPIVRKACDMAVGIPLAGGLNSLNVAVAAGVAMFQVAANRRTLRTTTGRSTS